MAGWDFCDLIARLRTWYFARDRDIAMQSDRKIFLGSGTEVSDSCLCPIGFIGMWSGAVENIPTGWQLCDGTAPTPDLTDFFIVGAGGTYDVGDTGGQSSINIQHDHSGATGSGTQHRHGYGNYGTNSDSHSHSAGTLTTDGEATHQHPMTSGLQKIQGWTSGASYDDETGGGDLHNHDVSGTTGSDSHSHSLNSGNSGYESSHTHSVGNDLSAAQSVLPPFYALALIMRVS